MKISNQDSVHNFMLDNRFIDTPSYSKSYTSTTCFSLGENENGKSWFGDWDFPLHQ